jgi:large subunit ribosomal protein L15
MDLSGLKYAPGSIRKRKRIGRGDASGHGGTSCRGHKGQRSRSGSKRRPWFEGGQMPLQRRLPKRGFTNIFRVEYQVVNLRDLERLKRFTKITPEVLYQNRLIRKKNQPVKILAEGELKKAYEISAHAFSRSAREKIEKAGGTAIVL